MTKAGWNPQLIVLPQSCTHLQRDRALVSSAGTSCSHFSISFDVSNGTSFTWVCKNTAIQFSVVTLYGFHILHYEQVLGITPAQHWQGIYLHIYALTWESMSLAASWWTVNISVTMHTVHLLPPLLACKCTQSILPSRSKGVTLTHMHLPVQDSF